MKPHSCYVAYVCIVKKTLIPLQSQTDHLKYAILQYLSFISQAKLKRRQVRYFKISSLEWAHTIAASFKELIEWEIELCNVIPLSICQQCDRNSGGNPSFLVVSVTLRILKALQHWWYSLSNELKYGFWNGKFCMSKYNGRNKLIPWADSRRFTKLKN